VKIFDIAQFTSGIDAMRPAITTLRDLSPGQLAMALIILESEKSDGNCVPDIWALNRQDCFLSNGSPKKVTKEVTTAIDDVKKSHRNADLDGNGVINQADLALFDATRADPIQKNAWRLDVNGDKTIDYDDRCEINDCAIANCVVED
jgi:hypothetical protein